jgi:hypothetical protein
MTGWTGPGTIMPLSRITVASMADMGYTVNLAMADPYTPSVMSSLLVQQTTQTGVDLISRKFFSSPSLGDAIVPGAGSALRLDTTASADSGLADITVAIDEPTSFNFVEPLEFPQSVGREALNRLTRFELPASFSREAIDALLTRAFEAKRDEESAIQTLARNDAQDAEFDKAWDEFGASISKDMWRTAAF